MKPTARKSRSATKQVVAAVFVAWAPVAVPSGPALAESATWRDRDNWDITCTGSKKNGDLHGRVVCKDGQGNKVREQDYWQGEPDYQGLSATYSGQNVLRESFTYEKGDKDGPYLLNGEDGKPLARGQYKQDREEGLFTYFDEAGRKTEEVTFAKGRRHGSYLQFDEQGRTVDRATYVDGKLSGKRTLWFGDGKLSEEHHYKAGKLHGTLKSYYKNGKPELVQTYSNGKLEGVAKVFYEDGKPLCQATFKDDELNGERVCLYRDGRVAAKETFKADVKVTGAYYDKDGREIQRGAYFDDGSLKLERRP